MTEARYDVLGIGNAIVDILARAEEDFLVEQQLSKGSMRLVDMTESKRLYAAMGPAIEASGGSAGNTVAGVASLGGKTAFVGKVADDELGAIYGHDMRSIGATFDVAPLVGGAPTARCMIFVTPDGERTMNTYLGACHALTPDDIDPVLFADTKITYFEGFLWDAPTARDAFFKAADIAHSAGRQVSLTLSDAFCVDRFRGDFLRLLRDGTIDILFANEVELKSFYETSSFNTALKALREDCRIATVTVGAEGSYVVTPDGIEHVPATVVEDVVDTTGAGDLYASGFLYAVAKGLDLRTAAALGSLAAGEVINHMGPRPATSLIDLARQSGYAL
ncbi:MULTISPECIES: adenosine kinase [Kaistia]|jgi:sugar/nucleoside kinase (ribokinase family)|uniref:Sugar/nucleoside kinase (Ribokinase family) n=1 Tax=Kaistia defluvii TaxID=410841 RepID=A0ABV2R2X5_9HYPH